MRYWCQWEHENFPNFRRRFDSDIAHLWNEFMSKSKNNLFEFFGFVFWLIVSLAIFFSVIKLGQEDNKRYKQILVENSSLMARKFKVQEIFSTRYGSKPANYYTVHECIVEDIDSKERLRVQFDDQTLPLVGDIWVAQIDERFTMETWKNHYKLYKKVR